MALPIDTRWRKAIKDLTVRKARTLTTLAGLVIGLWGMAAVTIAWVVLSNDLSENFARTLPPNLMVQAAAQPPPGLADIAGLDAIDNRPLLIGRIEAAPDFYMPLHLYVVEDFSVLPVARFFREDGAFPPPAGTMLIERAGEIILKIMRAQAAAPDPGDHQPHQITLPAEDGLPGGFKIQLPGGHAARTTLAGTVFDPGLAPSNQERIIYGYVSRETAEAWLPGGLPLRLVARTSEVPQQAVAGEIRARLQATDSGAVAASFPDPGKHPHQFQMDSILFLLGGLGALAFGMGAVLVINLVSGILSNQIRQIGSLKAVGATTGQVSCMYLASMLLLGLASSAIALPLAAGAGYGVCRVIAAMLNFDILTTHIPWPVYAALALAGGLFPVLAAWWPVRRWSKVAVRDALENYGARSQYQQGSLLDRASLPLPITVCVGLRNALRKPGRFVLGALTIAIGALIFMMAMNMRSSIVNTAAVEEATVLYDVSVAFEEDAAWEKISWMLKFPAVTDLELWPAAMAGIAGSDVFEAQSVPVLAVPADSWAIKPNLVEGAWLSDDKPAGVVATHRLLKRLPGLAVGGRLPLEIDGRVIDAVLIGIEKRFGPASLRMPLSGYRKLTGAAPDTGRVAFLKLDQETADRPERFVRLLESHFPLPGLSVRQVTTSRMAARIIRNHLDVIVAMLGVVAALMLIVSGLGMASGIGTSVIERTRELGVLRAIGASPGMVFRMLSVESMAVALSGWGMALLLADPLSRGLEFYLGNGIVEYPFDHKFSVTGMALCLAMIVVLALLATLGPARMATARPVREAVGYE